jgi:hypothetical protein
MPDTVPISVPLADDVPMSSGVRGGLRSSMLAGRQSPGTSARCVVDLRACEAP